MSEHLRENLANILSRNIRVKETIYGEKEYYFTSKTVDQLIAAIEEGITRCKACDGRGGFQAWPVKVGIAPSESCKECGGKGWVIK